MERPKSPEQSAETEGRSPDTGIEKEVGPEARNAAKDIRDIARSLTSAERLLTSSASLKELRNDKVREALQTKRIGLSQRLKKFSAIALAGIVSLTAALREDTTSRAESQSKETTRETAEPVAIRPPSESSAKETPAERSEAVDTSNDERAAILGLLLTIAEQLRQDKYPHEVGEPVDEYGEPVDEDGEPLMLGDPADPFSEASARESEMQRKIDETEKQVEREQAEQEMDDFATDQASAALTDLMTKSPGKLVEMLRPSNRAMLFAMYTEEADVRGVEQDLFAKKVRESLNGLEKDVASKVRHGLAMTETESKLAKVFAEQWRAVGGEDWPPEDSILNVP